MRFDEINLVGDFSLNGLTGNEGQFIGLSGGSLFWIEPAPSSQGFSVYGENYVYCNSVTYSATASAQNLFAAYASASNLSVSSTNRGAILIAPGTYDFDTVPLGLSLSYIDLVGVSPAASSVTLKASNAPYTLKYYEGVDTGLYNVGLTGGTTLAVLGSASTYLRWDNVDLHSESFRNNSNLNAFEDLNGEFKNINLINYSSLGLAKKNISAVFENVKSNNCSSFLSVETGNIIATISNVNLISNGGNFFIAQSGSIKGSYENINITETDSVFIGLTISGNFKNIRIKNAYTDFFYGNIFKSNVKDIKLEGNIARAFSGDIDSVFDNIHIENLSYIAFGDQGGVGSIKGTYSNILIDYTPDSFVAKSIRGNFSNIHIKDTINGNVFKSLNGDINGTFSNIKIDKSDSSSIDFFSSTGIINLNVYNVEIGDLNSVSGNIFYGTEVSGIYSNIIVGTSTGLEVFKAVNQIKGSFDDISVKDVLSFFKISQNDSNNKFTGSFSRISSGDITNEAFFNAGANGIIGSFIEIKLGNSTNKYFSTNDVGDIQGRFERIKLGNFTEAFDLFSGDIIGDFKKIYMGEATSVFTADNILSNLYEIRVKKAGGSFIATNNFDGIINDIIIEETITTNDKKDYLNCNGTISNIYCVNTIISDQNRFFSRSDINGTYENIYIGPVARIFEANSYSWNTKIRNLNVKGPFGGNYGFTGSISNSIIDAFGLDHAIRVGDGCEIERCRFISDSNQGHKSIHSGGLSVNCNITFTLTNAGIENTITNNIVDNRNIDSTYIRREGKF